MCQNLVYKHRFISLGNLYHVYFPIPPKNRFSKSKYQDDYLYNFHDINRYGQDVESLTIYMVNATDPYTPKKAQLWTMSGNRGDRWKGAEVHLNSPVDFQVS